MNALPAFWRRNDGAAAIDFALVATPFIALLFAALELFTLAFAQQNLETAAEAAGRVVLTGKASVMSQTQFQTAACQQLSSLFSCANLMVDVQVASTFSSAVTSAPTITYDQYGNVSNAWIYNTGSPGSIVVMRLMYRWPVFNIPGLAVSNQQGGIYLMMATAVFKNEAFN